MNMSDQERAARYQTMFGCSKEEHDAGVEDALKYQSASMLAGSILSDCQEELRLLVEEEDLVQSMNYLLRAERIRQSLNRAKAILFDKIGPKIERLDRDLKHERDLRLSLQQDNEECS